MKKIEPVAYMTYKGYLLHAVNPKVAEHDGPEPLYTREALEAVAEAVHKKTMHQFHMHIMSGDECEMPERINLDAIINQLTGE